MLGTERCWTPRETFPVAFVLAHILMGEEDVSGVALTGSVARKEMAHDIDLVVFSRMAEGSGVLLNDPEDRSCDLFSSTDPDVIGYCPIDLLEGVFPGVSEVLSVARGDIPVSYIVVDERIMWDCKVLQNQPQLVPDREFYQQVFCGGIPLLLLTPDTSRYGLVKYVERFSTFGIQADTDCLYIPYKRICHECSSEGCKPRKTWKEIQRERRERKNGGQIELF